MQFNLFFCLTDFFFISFLFSYLEGCWKPSRRFYPHFPLPSRFPNTLKVLIFSLFIISFKLFIYFLIVCIPWRLCKPSRRFYHSFFLPSRFPNTLKVCLSSPFIISLIRPLTVETRHNLSLQSYFHPLKLGKNLQEKLIANAPTNTHW